MSETKWKIKEFHPSDAYRKDIEMFLLDRTIIEITEQDDVPEGEFISGTMCFEPVDEETAKKVGCSMKILNEPFYFYGVILEEI